MVRQARAESNSKRVKPAHMRGRGGSQRAQGLQVNFTYICIIHMYVYVYYIVLRVYVYKYTCMHTYMHTYVRTFVYIHTDIHIPVQVFFVLVACLCSYACAVGSVVLPLCVGLTSQRGP